MTAALGIVRITLARTGDVRERHERMLHSAAARGGLTLTTVIEYDPAAPDAT